MDEDTLGTTERLLRNIQKRMSDNPKKTIGLIGVIVLGLIAAGYLWGVGDNLAPFNKEPDTTSTVQTTITSSTVISSSTIAPSNSPCSINTNGQSGGTNTTNCGSQPATYTWTNKNSWTALPHRDYLDQGEPAFVINLVFDATTGTLPSTACLNINLSGANVLPDSIATGGYSSENNGVWCMTSPYRHVVIEIYTDTIPTALNVQLVAG